MALIKFVNKFLSAQDNLLRFGDFVYCRILFYPDLTFVLFSANFSSSFFQLCEISGSEMRNFTELTATENGKTKADECGEKAADEIVDKI